MEERLQKIISRAGLASRRTAEEMILQGRVQVDGRVVKKLGAKADPERNDIRVDGRRVRPDRPRRYILLNKPKGYITTRSDPGSRPTVIELLPQSFRSVYPAGRLDMGTTGLMVLTDDGEFAQNMTHPRYGIEKTYLVTVRGTPDQKTLARAQKGIHLEGQKLRVKSVEVLSPQQRFAEGEREKTKLRVVLVEGKNREIRRLFRALGHPVLELHRSRLGFLSDRGLPLGAYRLLTTHEVRRFLKEAAAAQAGRAPREAGRRRRARRG